MKKYFNPNWQRINKTITSGSTEEKRELRDELAQLNKKIGDKFKEAYKAAEVKKRADHLQALKSLPIGATVFYKGFYKPLVFKSGEKVSDKRKYMVVGVEGKLWQIEYANLSSTELTEAEKDHVKNNVNWRGLFAKNFTSLNAHDL